MWSLRINYLLAMAMKKPGYQTTYVGKYHLGGMGNIPIEPAQRQGIDFFMGYQCDNGFDQNPSFNNEASFFDETNKRYDYSGAISD